MEEIKKTLRLESNNLSETKDFNRQLQLKRNTEKTQDLRKDLEQKNRKLLELQEANRALQQAQHDENMKADRKFEALRLKLEIEAKMREDFIQIKSRLEKDVEDAEKLVMEETKKRKACEEENWKLHMDTTEVQRKLEDLQEDMCRRVQDASLSKSSLQDTHEKLFKNLSGLVQISRKGRDLNEVEEFSQRLSRELKDQKKMFEDKISFFTQELQSEKSKRLRAEESQENMQHDYAALKDSLEEAKARLANLFGPKSSADCSYKKPSPAQLEFGVIMLATS